jgi:hypothetical protein
MRPIRQSNLQKPLSRRREELESEATSFSKAFTLLLRYSAHGPATRTERNSVVDFDPRLARCFRVIQRRINASLSKDMGN